MIRNLTRRAHRTREQIREHYEIEKELANRLRQASKAERRSLYAVVYNELFRRVPHHPQLTQKSSSKKAMQAVAWQLRLLRRFLDKNTTFLEIGSGDCSLSLEVSRLVKNVYAIDVSDEITQGPTFSSNFHLILSDGCSIPVPQNSINVAYSNQLMEHLHPDDALEQLRNIYSVLARGGIYLCITPNRLNGPHDVSQYFDDVATGFHLREYTFTELSSLFKEAGFSKIGAFVGTYGLYVRCPLALITLYESLLDRLPTRWRRLIGGNIPSRVLLGIKIFGTK